MDLDENGNAIITSAQDQYAFGMTLPGRKYVNQEGRFQGIQGMEVDRATGYTAFQLRNYDPRIGRWLSADPYRQHWSPYVAMGNNPIMRIDPDGGYDISYLFLAYFLGDEETNDYAEGFGQGLYDGLIGDLLETVTSSAAIMSLTGGRPEIIAGIINNNPIAMDYAETMGGFMKSFGWMSEETFNETIESLQNLKDLNFDDFISGMIEMVDDFVGDVVGEDGAYEMGVAHGKITAEIVSGLVTAGTGTAVKLMAKGGGMVIDVLKSPLKKYIRKSLKGKNTQKISDKISSKVNNLVDEVDGGAAKGAGHESIDYGGKIRLGPNTPAQRYQGPWTKGDLARANKGQGPIDMIPMKTKTGKSRPLELHHADNMPGSAIHEVPPSHPNTIWHQKHNQGVTNKMRRNDTQLHWYMRGQEMGNSPF